MKSSSFLCGILVGAALTVWTSKRKAGMLSSMGKAGSAFKWAGMTSGQHHTCSDHKLSTAAEAASETLASKSAGAAEARVHPSSVSPANQNHTKEYNLKQITDFIKSNADVRREVEAILRESHTVIPGL